MVARSPNAKPDRPTAAALAAAAALNPALVRETLKKVDRCMARLQELQYTVAGGAKVVSGVSLSPRSTRGYLRTSLRCKQETVRMRGGASAQKRSPNGKFGGAGGGGGCEDVQWRRMSLPAMLLGETVLEIVQASQFARDIVAVADSAGVTNREPKTPKPVPRTRMAAAAVAAEVTPLRARRAREKQSQRGGGAARADQAVTPPSRTRVRSRIQFKPVSPLGHGPLGRPSVSANRVSPKNRPWAKKTVMFSNPTFHSSASAAATACASPSPSKKQKRSYNTRSPVMARQTPHKFLIKSPPSALGSKLRSQGKALPAVSPPPPVKAQASPAKSRRRSFSPSRLASRLVSPIKARLSLNRSRDSGVGVGGGPMSGLKQRPGVTLTARTVSSRISSR